MKRGDVSHEVASYSYSAFGKLLGPTDPGGSTSEPPLFGWQGKRLIANNLYDSRARVWSADLGAFLQPDEYGYLTRGGTLWSWPGQNPYRWRDPSGRDGVGAAAVGVLDALAALSPSFAGVARATGPYAAALLAGAALGAFSVEVEDLAQEVFDQQDANADAIARAAAAATTEKVCGGVPEPQVVDDKLKNLVRDLYKGARTKEPIGTGSTADAIRSEAETGEPVGGKFHTQKGGEYARALENWLARNSGAAAGDRAAAESILSDLRNALAGK